MPSWYEEESDSGTQPSHLIENEIGREQAIPHSYLWPVPVVLCQAPEPDAELHSFPIKDLILFQRCPYRYRLNKEWGFVLILGLEMLSTSILARSQTAQAGRSCRINDRLSPLLSYADWNRFEDMKRALQIGFCLL